jgi:hypothetical protein
MKAGIQVQAAGLLTLMPFAARASETVPHIVALYALGGGAAGGFLGALIACWLCKRMTSKKDRDSNK